MKGNPKVIDYLNKALRHELTAVNQYWLHYRMLDNWGYKVLAKQWRKESIEEMQHADKLIERIIFLDGLPNMQTLESLHIGQTVKEVLERDLHAEMEARALYEESATHCHAVKDYVTRDLFEQLPRRMIKLRLRSRANCKPCFPPTKNPGLFPRGFEVVS
jgi:bacterioferritin